MPRIAKGGKWIYGWVVISKNGRIQIPPESKRDYEFRPGDKVIAIPGSKISGGFGLAKMGLIGGTPLSRILGKRGQTARLEIDRDGQIQLSVELLKHYTLRSKDRLLLVKGSRHALGFVARGPIFEGALKHPELPTS